VAGAVAFPTLGVLVLELLAVAWIRRRARTSYNPDTRSTS